jgi:hypothetical protein
LSDTLIPNQETLENLAALEDVVMVGYPSGLWDSVNNLPILRRGITASHPATNFQRKGARSCRYGVLFAGPVYKADEKIEVVEIPTHSVAIPVTTMPIHLGYYVKGSALVNFRQILLKAWNL